MQESILLRSLRRLSDNDWRGLAAVVRSPWFQKRPEVEKLFDYLSAAIRARGEGYLFDRKKVWEAIMPGQPYDDARMRYLMSWLLDALRDYLIQTELDAEKDTAQMWLCRALRKRGMDDLFEREQTKTDTILEKKTWRNARFHFDRYQIRHESLERSSRQQRDLSFSLQPLSDELTVFYVAEMLRHACGASTHQATSGQAYDERFFKGALQMAEENDLLRYPTVGIYYYAYKALTEPGEAHFNQFKQEIEQHWTLFPPPEIRALYLFAINFCIRRLNSGQRAYIREGFELYRAALERQILLENGQLSGFAYKNIIRLGAALGENDWVEHFLENYKKSLPSRERDNIYRYNLAFFYFQQKRYTEAMPLLQQAQFDDVLNNLDARRMLLRIYVELGEWQALDWLLERFSAYLRRHTDLGYGRENYLNLIRFTRRLIELPPGQKDKVRKLHAEVQQAERVAEKEWLLEKIGERSGG